MMKVLKIVVASFYILVLCYVVFFARRREAMQDTRRRELINVVPVVNQFSTYQGLSPLDQKGKRNFVLNLLGNILLFVPFPALVYFFGLKKRKHILVAAFLATSGIEAIQLAFHIGVPDIDDVLLNMTGAYLGVLFLKQVPMSVRSALYRI
ncbi:MAG TPA: VanZ family protein [Flavisolibacter sp.]|jgi:glycopeptide antibiotics resistance protein|nr:VanZ family protein [Flavisolibacter sp.]